MSRSYVIPCLVISTTLTSCNTKDPQGTNIDFYNYQLIGSWQLKERCSPECTAFPHYQYYYGTRYMSLTIDDTYTGEMSYYLFFNERTRDLPFSIQKEGEGRFIINVDEWGPYLSCTQSDARTQFTCTMIESPEISLSFEQEDTY